MFPTFFDEIIAHVPTDRWMRFSELRDIMKPKGMSYSYIKTCLVRGRRCGMLLHRDTGIKKEYSKQKKSNGPTYPVYEYIRVSNERYVSSSSATARISRRGQKYEINKPPKIKKHRVGFNSKLDEEKVRQIRILLNGGAKVTEISRMYKLHHTSVYRIRNGKCWRHVR